MPLQNSSTVALSYSRMSDEEGFDPPGSLSSFRVSHILRIPSQQMPENLRAKSMNLKLRELDAVNKKWGLVGFTLTLPTFSPERPYQIALDLSIRISKCVIPPAASEIHMTRPAGSKSMELMRMSPEEKISLEIPEPIERHRIVQS